MNRSAATEVLKNVLSFIPFKRILLFGSRARGMEGPGSDYDVLLIVEQTLPHAEKFRMSSKARRLLAQEHIDADVIIRSEQEVEATRELRGSIVRNALLEGVAI
jgi:predicted nucleotidyltransferase